MEQAILTDINKRFGLVPTAITPVSGGWLNEKWKLETEKGIFLVKRYSKIRYDGGQLENMEQALQRGMVLSGQGIKCPRYLTDNGAAVLYLRDGTAYSVMDFCAGKNKTAKTISMVQMRDLGRVLAQIHRGFSGMPIEGVKGYPLENLFHILWDNYKDKSTTFSDQNEKDYQDAVRMQEPILRQLTPDFFDDLPKGISHEDFAPDNLLFDEQGVAAVVDFDRNQYSYLWHDVGRVLLSFCRNDDGLDIDKIEAFRNGYNEYLPLTMQNVVDAFKITWCIEVLWWIQPGCFMMPPCKATEYRDELIWLTKNWDRLESLMVQIRPFL